MTQVEERLCVSVATKKQKAELRYPAPIQKLADGIRKEMEKVRQTPWQQKTTFP
jgi:hypothetical protein